MCDQWPENQICRQQCQCTWKNNGYFSVPYETKTEGRKLKGTESVLVLPGGNVFNELLDFWSFSSMWNGQKGPQATNDTDIYKVTLYFTSSSPLIHAWWCPYMLNILSFSGEKFNVKIHSATPEKKMVGRNLISVMGYGMYGFSSPPKFQVPFMLVCGGMGKVPSSDRSSSCKNRTFFHNFQPLSSRSCENRWMRYSGDFWMSHDRIEFRVRILSPWLN